MNFVTWAIRNPIPVIVLFIALLIAGIIGFVKIGVQDQPDIDFPAVTVSVAYPGAPPSQMESEVTRKIEDAISTITGIEHITSTINEGVSTTNVEFHFERNINEALDNVRDAVTRVRSDLPQSINEPIVSRVTVAGQPVLTFGVASDSMTDEELSWFVDLTLMREITSVKGVGRVNRVGGVSREVLVELDPDRMAAIGASAGNVSQQLRVFQAEYPGGAGRIGGREQNVRTVGTIKSAQELAAMPIALPDGRTVRLDDIASVHDQAAEIRRLALLDGRPIIGFEVSRAWGASALGVADATREAVARLQQQYPQIKFTVVNSTVESIRESYKSSMEMLLEGALLTFVVVWLFLRDWRATVISAAALPLAIVPTFWAMYMLNYSLNTLTLLALSLIVGVLVDDAIVEVENNVRHLRMGKPPLQAATEAAIEIGLAVVATTFTLCAVFVPVAFMNGVSGEFFRPFAFTATVAVLFSLVVARMLTPMMAAHFMKANELGNEDGRVKLLYLRCVRYCLAHRRLTLGVATAIFLGTIGLGRLLPTTFRPAGDQGLSMLQIELPPGASIEQTRDAAEQARHIIARMPEVQQVYTTIGATTSAGFGGGTAGEVRRATLAIKLKPKKDRKLTQPQFEARVTPALRVVAGVRTSFQSFSGGGKLQITLVGDDSDQLALASGGVERDLRALPGLGGITSSASLLQPEIVVRPLPERAAELGVSTEALSAVTRIATSGDVDQVLAKLNLPTRQIPIRVRLADDVRGDLERIRTLYVPAALGAVQLTSVAEVSLGAGPAEIHRYDRERNVTVEADLNGQPLGDVMAKAKELPALQHLPQGVRQVETGDAQWIRELFIGFFAAMAIGILCIYAVLVLLFREFLQPLTILSALPPSAGGALLGLFVFGMALSISTLIGLLMLMGIVTKNSILLVEYAEKARRQGLPRLDALLDACSKRVRPIVMTTVAMGAGMMPVAVGWAGDPSFRAPMGVTVICGLVASTGLSLFVVPVIFTLIDDVQLKLARTPGWIGERLAGWLARWRSGTAG